MLFQAVLLPTYMRKVSGSNLVTDTDCQNRYFSVAFPSPSGKTPAYCLQLGHDRFLPYSFRFSVLGRCIFCIADSVVKEATVNIRRESGTFSVKLFEKLKQIPRGKLGHFI
jgi:hypothetical protein